MEFSPKEIEMARQHFENKLKITLGPVEMKEMMDDPSQKGQFIIVDVRNRDGYRTAHVPGAINIPADELGQRLQELPRDKAIIVYCWSLVCHLAAHAGLTLAQNGYFVRELEGGIEEWQANGMPVEAGEMATAQ